MADPSLAGRIRDAIEAGVLPRAGPVKTWAGNGRGQLCHGCGNLILRAQIEYEIDMEDGGTFRFHIGCQGLWVAECVRLGYRRLASSG